jgi:hypothetical protein
MEVLQKSLYLRIDFPHQTLHAGCRQMNAHFAAISNKTANRQQTRDYIDGISYGFG